MDKNRVRGAGGGASGPVTAKLQHPSTLVVDAAVVRRTTQVLLREISSRA